MVGSGGLGPRGRNGDGGGRTRTAEADDWTPANYFFLFAAWEMAIEPQPGSAQDGGGRGKRILRVCSRKMQVRGAKDRT